MLTDHLCGENTGKLVGQLCVKTAALAPVLMPHVANQCAGLQTADAGHLDKLFPLLEN